MRNYVLDIDARILELLGPNLYTNIYYVLAELIANAYDADAKNVYIISNKDDIRVEDDGHGMSYKKGEVDKYLKVAAISRSSENDSFTKSGKRRKMGRKGVGKLAALSVSENVDIMTVSNGEKSGFILTRHPMEGNKLKEIQESKINFIYVKNHGSAVVMRNPEYRLHNTLDSIKRNLLKIFPLVNSNFKIHIIRSGKEKIVINKFDENIMKELCALITFGHKFMSLGKLVPVVYKKRQIELVEARNKKTIPIVLKEINGKEHEYNIDIMGWIGTYTSTRGRKSEMTDFPDNFISLFSNQKLGEFNVLPLIGQNKLNEVYVVGQLYIDLFELSELPDMALSNRQGYKTDDLRYVKVMEFLRKELLPDILKKRELFTDLNKEKKKKEKIVEQLKEEENLKKSVDEFRENTVIELSSEITELGIELPQEQLKTMLAKYINESSKFLGLKQIVDSNKKKILISQTLGDKSFSDIIFQMLLFNDIPAEDILYTNCDDEVCRVPDDVNIYKYLREFFVKSYSDQLIYVLFITSENTKKSWGAITEVGAAWITQIDHKIFNISPFRPEHPLHDEAQWQSTNRDKDGELWMTPLNADILCQKIESLCDRLKYKKKDRKTNNAYLKTLVQIKSKE
jgi:hypothetical protein